MPAWRGDRVRGRDHGGRSTPMYECLYCAARQKNRPRRKGPAHSRMDGETRGAVPCLCMRVVPPPARVTKRSTPSECRGLCVNARKTPALCSPELPLSLSPCHPLPPKRLKRQDGETAQAAGGGRNNRNQVARSPPPPPRRRRHRRRRRPPRAHRDRARHVLPFPAPRQLQLVATAAAVVRGLGAAALRWRWRLRVPGLGRQGRRPRGGGRRAGRGDRAPGGLPGPHGHGLLLLHAPRWQREGDGLRTIRLTCGAVLCGAGVGGSGGLWRGGMGGRGGKGFQEIF